MLHINPITTDNFDRFNYESYPPIPESEKNKRITLLDHAKSFELEFKIMSIYFKIFAITLFQVFIKDYSNKKAVLKHQIRHLRQDDNDFEIKRLFGKNLITPSRNIIRMKVFESKQFTYKGFCAGATQNFAEHLLPFLMNEKADEIVERIAYQYKTGMGVDDAASQYLYENAQTSLSEKQQINKTLKLLQKGGEISQLEKELIQNLAFWFLDPTNKVYPDKLGKLFNDIYANNNSSEKAEFIKKYLLKDLIEIIKIINSSYTEYKKDTEPSIAWSSVVKEKINAQKADIPLIADWLLAFVKKYSNEIDRGWKTKSITKPKKSNLFLRKIKKIVAKIFSIFKKQKKSKQYSKLLDLHIGWISNLKQSKKSMEKTNLKLKPSVDKIGLSGHQSDAEYLKNLNNLEIGVYEVDFYTEDSAHATLFINLGIKKYFWDPNFGLFLLDRETPEKTILKVISSYSKPKKNSSNNHDISISQYENKI